MKNIITYNGKPIYTSADIIDWFLVIIALHNELTKEGTIMKVPDYDEYRLKNTFWGDTINGIFMGYDIKLWQWNQVERDWILKTRF